jgi:CheY-like chemotaxis protein
MPPFPPPPPPLRRLLASMRAVPRAPLEVLPMPTDARPPPLAPAITLAPASAPAITLAPASTGSALLAAPPLVFAPVPAIDPGGHAKVVVLAEDDPETRQLLVQSLGREYRVFVAADGQAALELLARIDRPAVVILDINMPHVDGLGVAAEIKQTPQLKDVPIIFLTCLDSAQDTIRGIQAGARNYMTKPFAISKLMEKVAKASGQSS